MGHYSSEEFVVSGIQGHPRNPLPLLPIYSSEKVVSHCFFKNIVLKTVEMLGNGRQEYCCCC